MRFVRSQSGLAEAVCSRKLLWVPDSGFVLFFPRPMTDALFLSHLCARESKILRHRNPSSQLHECRKYAVVMLNRQTPIYKGYHEIETLLLYEIGGI